MQGFKWNELRWTTKRSLRSRRERPRSSRAHSGPLLAVVVDVTPVDGQPQTLSHWEMKGKIYAHGASLTHRTHLAVDSKAEALKLPIQLYVSLNVNTLSPSSTEDDHCG